MFFFVEIIHYGRGSVMDKKKISMIVPIYGVEPHIRWFLKSLTKNLHDEMEVILVNDGTKDRSGEIVDAFQAKHPNHVQVIHKENGGVSSARNVGLARARGEYILFADPDDCLADDYTETILKVIDAYRREDIIVFDYYEERNGKVKYKSGTGFAGGQVDKRAFLTAFAKDNKIRNYLCNKIIKKSVCSGMRFDETIRYCEDASFLTDVMLNADSIAYVKKAVYYYIRRERSLTAVAQTSAEDIACAIRIVSERCDKYQNVIGKISYFAPMKFMALFCRGVYQGTIVGDTTDYEKYIRKNVLSVLWDKEVPMNQKKRLLILALGLGRFYWRKK